MGTVNTNAPAVTRPVAKSAAAEQSVVDETTNQAPVAGQAAPAEETAEAQAPAAAPKKEGRGLFGHFADVFIGGGSAIWDMAKGIGTLIAHPIQTVKGLGYAITHPAALFHAFVDPYASAMAEGRPGLALGRGIVEIGSFFIGAGAGGAGAKGASAAGNVAAKAGETANVVSKAGRAAGAASKAGKVAATASYASTIANGASSVASKASALTKAAAAAKAAGHASKATKLAAQAAKLTKYSAALKDAAKIAKVGDAAAIVAARAAVEAATKARGLTTALAAASNGSKAANLAGRAGEVANLAARLGEVPIMTKAAQVAVKQAGISTKLAQSALNASHAVYWEARAAGKSVAVAKAAAAAKAAKIMGVAKNATAVEKIVNGARLAGAATDASKWLTRTNYVQRPLVNSAKLLGGTVDKGIVTVGKVGTYIADAAKGSLSKLGKLGELTVRDLLLAPITIPLAGFKAIGNIFTHGLDGLRALKIGEIATAPIKVVSAGAAAVGGMKIGDIIGGIFRAPGMIAKAALHNPAALIRPAATIGMIQRLGQGALATAGNSGKPNEIGDEQAAALAEKYGLEPTMPNVQNFLAEVQSYAGNTIGPDAGTPEQVKQLQTVLRAYGYDVDPTGTFDDKTANAVIDFKTKHGISQSYNLADGKPAVNEYVDEATAQAIVAALKAGEKASVPAPAGPATEAPATETPEASTETPATDTPATEPPANAEAPLYTVTATDRAAGLSGIARRYLGDANRWKEIYDLNKDKIGNNPNMILAGQKLTLPADAKGVPGQETKPATKPAAETPKPAVKPAPKPAVEAPMPTPKPNATQDESGISDAQVSKLAKDYGLKPGRTNIEAFSLEVNSYRESAIGPDTGDKDTITKLQQVLGRLGYKIGTSGTFDDDTANAVIEFKTKNGIHQTYRLANGDWAINEYVDEATAQAMATSLK